MYSAKPNRVGTGASQLEMPWYLSVVMITLLFLSEGIPATVKGLFRSVVFGNRSGSSTSYFNAPPTKYREYRL